MKKLFILAWIFMMGCIVYVAIQVNRPMDVKLTDVKVDHVIDEGILYGKFNKAIKTVTWEQETEATQTYVDSNLFGERHTKLDIHSCVYQMGFDHKDVHIRGKDDKNGIVYVSIGKPIMISLNIDYDKIDFKETKGLFRLSMNDKEEKKFYKIAKDNVRDGFMSNEKLIDKVDELNKVAIKKLIMETPNVKKVVFE